MAETFFISQGSFLPEWKLKLQDALNILLWQKTDQMTRTDNPLIADYTIMTYDEYKSEFGLNHPVRSLQSRWYILFRDGRQFTPAMKALHPTKPYSWVWKWVRKDSGDIYGYEVTSHGDRRYSPFFQKVIHEGELITSEEWYQRVIKPAKENGTYVPGTGHKFMNDYMYAHPGLLYELAIIGKSHPFTDMFDQQGGQNAWYAEILNKYYGL